MTTDLYVSVSSLDVIFAHSLIGSLKRVLLWSFFYSFLHIVCIYNTIRLMIQMNTMKKNLMNLDLNMDNLVRSVPDWVGCCVAKDLL